MPKDTMLDQILTRRTLYAAFERVRDNAGCRSVDGVTVGEFHDNLETELDHIQDRLLRRRYQCVPTVRDRVVQTATDLVTREIFEREFEDCSYAFREGRSVKDAVHRIDDLRRQGFRWVVDADIEGFFDNGSSYQIPPFRFSPLGGTPRNRSRAWLSSWGKPCTKPSPRQSPPGRIFFEN